jgi:hypothetical protein
MAPAVFTLNSVVASMVRRITGASSVPPSEKPTGEASRITLVFNELGMPAWSLGVCRTNASSPGQKGVVEKVIEIPVKVGV